MTVSSRRELTPPAMRLADGGMALWMPWFRLRRRRARPRGRRGALGASVGAAGTWSPESAAGRARGGRSPPASRSWPRPAGGGAVGIGSRQRQRYLAGGIGLRRGCRRAARNRRRASTADASDSEGDDPARASCRSPRSDGRELDDETGALRLAGPRPTLARRAGGRAERRWPGRDRCRRRARGGGPVEPRENRSKIRSRSSGAMPGPASSTRKRTEEPCSSTASRVRAAGVALGVLEQVGEDPLETALVHEDVPRRHAGGELDRDLGRRSPRTVCSTRVPDRHLVAGEVARRLRRGGRSRADRRRADGTGEPRRRAGRAPAAPSAGARRGAPRAPRARWRAS